MHQRSPTCSPIDLRYGEFWKPQIGPRKLSCSNWNTSQGLTSWDAKALVVAHNFPETSKRVIWHITSGVAWKGRISEKTNAFCPKNWGENNPKWSNMGVPAVFIDHLSKEQSPLLQLLLYPSNCWTWASTLERFGTALLESIHPQPQMRCQVVKICQDPTVQWFPYASATQLWDSTPPMSWFPYQASLGRREAIFQQTQIRDLQQRLSLQKNTAYKDGRIEVFKGKLTKKDSHW